MRQIITFNNKNVVLPEPWAPSGPANNEIWYTSSDGNIVSPYQTSSLPTIVSNTYVNGKGVIKFASDITIIGSNAFYYCSGLTSVMIPNSVTSIGYAAFAGCSSLTSFSIPNSVTNIGKFAFYECRSLTSVAIPNSVTSIEDKAFYYCTRLTTISYTGTIAQYNAITKESGWHDNVPATVVHCTDGDAPI